jgi:hypothetical protein
MRSLTRSGDDSNEDERGIPMVSEVASNRQMESSPGRPLVTSYDSGYEHSPEHWLEVKQLVEAAAAEPVRKAPVSLAKAS